MKKILRMQFETEGGTSSFVTVPDPKADLTEETIKAAMLTLIEKDIFKAKDGSLALPISAKIIETSQVVYDLV